jgi:hypothetical protein
MITVYLGDVDQYLQQVACAVDPNAQLITQDNFNNLCTGVYYTSLGDLGNLLNLSAVLLQADKIVYCPPAAWSDQTMQQWTEDYLNVFKFKCKVKNYSSQPEFDQILKLADVRRTPDPQLWIAGCSISHGVGVRADTRYGKLLADQLDLKVSFLTQSGSSNTWAADQILRSDIKPNDIVVWGVTSHARLSKFEKNNFSYLTINRPDLDKCTLNFLASDHVVYQSVTSILQVINFCQKVKATLVLAALLDDHIVNYIQNLPNLIVLYKLWGRDIENLFLDAGTDGEHPGVKTHEFYAYQIYQKLVALT